jgi:DNA-binding CsgD family transcriptional regulator/pimeloyl-ACP methyl ester carboxylesterase
MPPLWSHALLWAEQAYWQYVREIVATGRQFIAADLRGSGTSTRDVHDYSLDALAGDVEAVADQLGLDRFDLAVAGMRAPAGLRFARRHPARVRRLVLWLPTLPHAAWARLVSTGVMSDFEGFNRLVGLVTTSDRDEANALSAFFSRCIEQRDAARLAAAFDQYNVDDDLPCVSAPALVIHATGLLDDAPPRLAVAERMPAAEFVSVGPVGQPATRLRAAELTAEFLNRDDPAVNTSHLRPAAVLTRSETAVLTLLASGLTNAEIAAKRTVAQATVATQVQHIFRKIGAGNRVEAAAWAVKHGLV